MNKFKYKYWRLLIAVIALFAGVIAQYIYLKKNKEFEKNVAKRIEIIRELSDILDELGRINNAKEFYKNLTNCVPVQISTLLDKTMPGVKPDDTRLIKKDIGDGWILNEQEIVLSDVDFAQVFRFLKEGESVCPPWVLRTCSLKAGRKKAGTGNAILGLIAVEYNKK